MDSPRKQSGFREPSPFPFSADMALRHWIKTRKNDKWYDQRTREELYKDVLFWLSKDEPASQNDTEKYPLRAVSRGIVPA